MKAFANFNFSQNEILTRNEQKSVKGAEYISCTVTYYNPMLGWTKTSYSTQSSNPVQAAYNASFSMKNAHGTCSTVGTNDSFKF